jgi:CRP/FNR family cyclic AMP-dependent transcriptional regulator
MNRAIEDIMPGIPDTTVFQKMLAALPLVTYRAGDTVFTAGSRTGLLLILEKGSVAVVKDTTEIAKVTEPGAVFGELSVLLDKPHTADVRALESSEFRVANADTLLVQNPTALFYIATVLARRLDVANQVLIELKSQLKTNQPHSEIKKTIENMEELLSVSGASLAYAGYPYDPFK